MKRNTLLILILIIGLLLTGCQTGLYLRQYEEGSEYDQYHEDYDVLDKGPVAGGTLNLFTTAPDSLNPILTKNTYTADFLSFIYEGLTRLDANQKAVAMLSDSWSASPDGLIWTFHIRNGIKWHDGEPFTAYDVEFTIQALLNPGINSVYKPLLASVVTCAAVDSSNIRLVLESPNSFMPEMMTFPIIAKHQFAQKDILSASEQFSPTGTGPYRFVSYEENVNVEMKMNTEWWYITPHNAGEDKAGADSDSAETAGRYIETIMVKIYKNPDDKMVAFQTDDLDVASVDAANYPKYKGRIDLTFKKYTSRDFEFLTFNLNNPIFEDIYVRKAISMSIDIEAIINEEMPGEAVAAELPILPESWISNLEGVQAAPLYDKVNGVTSDKVATAGSDDAAISITALTPIEVLKEGGWKENKQGIYKSIGGLRKYLKVELLVNANNSTRVRIANRICEQIIKAGIPAEVKEVQWDDMMNRINTLKYDMAFIGCKIPQIPDLSYLYSNSYLYSSISGISDSAYNASGYNDSLVNTGITEIFKEKNEYYKKRIYKAMKDQILKDSPYIGLYFLRDVMVYSKDIKGPLQPDTWNRYDNMSQWYKPKIP